MEEKRRFYVQLTYTKQVVAIFCAAIMVLVTFQAATHDVGSEVGSPDEGEENTRDWIIEDGDKIVKANEDVILDGNLIIHPGGNLTLYNVKLEFGNPSTGNYGILVQLDDTTFPPKYGELYIINSEITTRKDGPSIYFDFVVHGNMTISQSTISNVSFVGQGTDMNGGIQIYSDNVIISESTIEYCEKVAIYTEADPSIVDNEIRNNEYGIVYHEASENITSIESHQANEQYGTSVSASTDINGDGIDDLVVGTPENSD